jgi:radical SAM superfamily enzyme YgiQ (UPF0313 family)
MRILYLPNSKSQQRQLEKPVQIYPVQLAMEATYYRNKGHEVHWGNERGTYDKVITEPERLDFLSLPIPDRIFTDALNPRYQRYGNYKFHPATHMLSAIGCWWARCGFCIEKGREMTARPLDSVIQEIKECKKIGIVEIFDDSATFPDKRYLEEFCKRKIEEGLADIKFGCNMRIDSRADYKLMKKAGFRMLLYGIESANQKTLDKIGKGSNAEKIIPIIKEASDAGLEPHITSMFGYSWESHEEELNTLKLVHYLLRKGYAKTAQASVYSLPRTEPDPHSKGHRYTKRIYECALYPDFWYNKLRDLKCWEDVKYLFKGIRKGIVRD